MIKWLANNKMYNFNNWHYILTVDSFLWMLLIIGSIDGKEIHTKDKDGTEKLKICIVEGNRGTFRKTEKYCPILERDTNIQCIIGVDRLDCVRRIQKGYAHFGIFSSEDLVAARWAGVEVLVTSELRFHSEPFEYDVVAVVDNEAEINTAADLRGSRFCHPGKGMENHWNDIIADYFESTIVQRECENDLTVVESRIKASANFFGASCKAGPWVSDVNLDRTLKSKYPSLCSMCYNPTHCGIGDKHWGRRGPLYCLTSGAGQVAWVRLDDVKSHFGYSGLKAESDPNGYSFLCPDGHLQPLNTNSPCIWISKPWPVVASRRSHAQKVQDLFGTLKRTGESDWQNALLLLIESYHVNITSLDITVPIEDYLDQAPGFQSAYSFPSCNPPRSIVYCTTSLLQFAKCSWLQEVSSVYGIEPNLQCIRGEHIFRCLDDVANDIADVVLVDQDSRLFAQRDYNLTAILHEFSSQFKENYVTIAVVRADSPYKTLEDLEGKSACFPNYEGGAFVSVMDTLNKLKLVQSNCSSATKNYFSNKGSCVWDDKSKKCPDKYMGDVGALRCLTEGRDVAFLSIDVFNNLTTKGSNEEWTKKLNAKQFRFLCPFENTNKKHWNDPESFCYLNWLSRGSILINKNKTQLRRNEILNSLKSIDNIFGKNYKSNVIPFTLFGEFDRKKNVIFRDSTDSLKTSYELNHKVKFQRNQEEAFVVYSDNNKQHCHNNALNTQYSILLVVLSLTIKFYF